jgi:hypothetical protein
MLPRTQQIKQNKTKQKKEGYSKQTPLKIKPRNSLCLPLTESWLSKIAKQSGQDFPKLSPKFFQRLLQIQSHQKEEAEAGKTPRMLKSKFLSLSLSLSLFCLSSEDREGGFTIEQFWIAASAYRSYKKLGNRNPQTETSLKALNLKPLKP